MLKALYQLTKPGIIYGNKITAIAGFFLASGGYVDVKLLLATLAGLTMIIASGCVANNILDRSIDARMARTQGRALVTGKVTVHQAVLFSTALLVAGIWFLYTYTNLLALQVALVGWVFYVCIYTPLKRRTSLGTIIGSISGAVPPVVGYTAVANQLDTAALILFLILVCWQMPHFYAISIYRIDEYAAASIPVLPIRKNISVVKAHILLYIVGFIFACSLLTYYGFTGYFYLGIVTLIGLLWLRKAIRGYRAANDKLWAKQMFRFSLVVLLVFSIMVSIDGIMSV